MHWLVRLVSALMLSLFLGVPAFALAAPLFQGDCCGEQERERGCPNDDCECPLSCAPCCAGASARVIPPVPMSEISPAPLHEMIEIPAPEPPHAKAEPGEIVHVPKA